jgi:hypothetical protein
MGSVKVATAEQLLRAVSDRSVHHVEVAIPGVDADEARGLEERVNEQLQACGCSEGSVGLFAALGAALTVWQMDWLSLHGRPVVVAIASTAFLGIGVGKMVGHHRGRRRAGRLAADYASGTVTASRQRNSVPPEQAQP